MPFRLLPFAERTLNRLRLTHKIAVLGVILGLPLILLLFWQGVQFRRWGEDELLAARRIERQGIFTQLLQQLARRADFGLEPRPTVLHEQPDALKHLDDQIHQSLIALDLDGWRQETLPTHQHPEARLFLTALRGLPSITSEVTPQEWREHHHRTLERLVEIIPAAASKWKAESETERANILVEQFLTDALPHLVVRLGVVTEFVNHGTADDATPAQRRELLLNLGRIRQAEADAIRLLSRIEKAHPQVVGQVGTVLISRLQDFTHTLDRIEAWEASSDTENDRDPDAVWRNSIAARQATEQAALVCATNLAEQHEAEALRWQRLSLLVYGLTLVVGSVTWGMVLWMQSAVQRSTTILHDVSRISPTADDVPPPVPLEGLDGEFSDVVRSFHRTIGLIQTNNGIAQEAARRACLAELASRRNEEKYELLAAATNEGHWDWDIRTDHVVLSSRVWKWLGYRPEHTPRPSYAGFVELIHADDRAAATAALDAHLRRRDPYDCEFRLKNIVGSYRWFHATGQAKWDTSGRPYRMAGTFTDVTDRRRLEEEHQRYVADLQASRDQIAEQAAQLLKQTESLKHAQKRAEDATRSKSEFLANMSHELRTPLTAILGYSDLLYDDGDLAKAPRSRLDMIDTIRLNGRHLLQIIEDILDLSKIEAGKMAIESIPCHPATILDEARRLLELRALSKGLEFDVRANGLLPSTCLSDAKRIRQILFNLVGNAIKFTESGRVTLEMSADPGTPARLQFVVTDTGIGMTAAQLRNLFQPFGQADASTTRKFGGSGLGLSISRRLAELLHGDIAVESESGRGSKFTVWIEVEVPAETPWQTVDAPTMPVTSQAAPAAVPLRLLEGARVLVADDVEPNRRLLTFLLNKSGAEVLTACDGLEALELMATAEQDHRPVDLVLMDMQMPNLNGDLATRRLRENGCRVPIIAMTAGAMAEDRAACIAAGCDDYLLKPIDRRALIEVCSRFREAVRSSPPAPL